MRTNCAVLPSPLRACTAITAEILNFVIDPVLSGPGLATKDKHYGGHKEYWEFFKGPAVGGVDCVHSSAIVADGFRAKMKSERDTGYRGQRRYELRM